MAEVLLGGDTLAKQTTDDVRRTLVRLKEMGEVPSLATVLVGEDPASKNYVGMKQQKGHALGIGMREVVLPADVSQAELDDTVAMLSQSKVDGVLIQFPLPGDLDYFSTINQLDPKKDVDGLHPANLGQLFYDQAEHRGIVPCTPQGIIQLLKYGNVVLDRADVAVVGNGRTVGAPLAAMLPTTHLGTRATVTTLHEHTKQLGQYTQDADIVIGATPVPHLIDGTMIKEGATLVSVGVRRIDGKSYGNFTDDAKEKAGVYVPVTGGIGPLTIANLWVNTLRCFELNHPDVVMPGKAGGVPK